MNEEFDFDTEFMTDEEVEAMLDSIVMAVGDRIAEEESKTSIVNPQRYGQVALTYKLLRYMTSGTRAKVTYTLNEPYPSMGFVSVVGTNISFSHPEWLRKVAEYASNVEVYPKTDGTVQMNFTFHGLTIPLE